MEAAQAPRVAPEPAARAVPVVLRSLLAASLLVPLLLLAGAAWLDHRRLVAGAYADVSRLSAIAKEHALKVVETNALVLDRIEDRVHGLSWEEIAAQGDGIYQDLRALDEAIAQIAALHIVRPDGRMEIISLAWPTPQIDVADRSYFRRLAAGESKLVFGEPLRARLTGRIAFTMSRRRGAPDGRFDGIIVGSIHPGYFQAQWHAMDPEGRARFALLRMDGQVLATHPRGESDLIGPPDPATVPRGVREAGYQPAIERLGARGEWLTAFRRVGEHPLVVGVTLSLDRVRARWMANTALTAVLCLLASLALGGVTLLAIRRWRSEQLVLARLSRTAQELREEIARREEAEADLRQAQRLEALGRLTGGIAHDFNNLLTAILGTVHLLEQRLGPEAGERIRKLLGTARDAVNRGAALNASLLAFARRQMLNTTVLDANALVRDFAPLIQRALGEAVTFTLDLDPTLPSCRADAAQLESALLNLAINARDAMPEGGTATLSTRLTRLGPAALAGNPDARPGEYVAIGLEDTGVGMPPEVRDRAFEPFFTTKPVGKGTGLGLSQVFGFIRQLGGHVAIDSAPGRGTRVTLFLLAQPMPPHPTTPPPASARALPAARGTVLLVEDDERVRRVTAETLRDAGFKVLAVSDGQEALALLVRGEPMDVLFSDIVMPGGISGIDLAFASHRLRPGMPVLLTTGYAGAETGGEDHGFEVMAKPYDQSAVVRRIAELIAAAPRGAT